MYVYHFNLLLWMTWRSKIKKRKICLNWSNLFRVRVASSEKEGQNEMAELFVVTGRPFTLGNVDKSR